MIPDYVLVLHANSSPDNGTTLVRTYSAITDWAPKAPALGEGLLGSALQRTERDPTTGSITAAQSPVNWQSHQ